MSVQALVWALDAVGCDPLEKLLLIYLADRADEDGEVSADGAEGFCNSSSLDVARAFAGLVGAGLIAGDLGSAWVLAPNDRPPSRSDWSPSTTLRAEMIAEAGGVCVACGSDERLCIDHIIPRRRGGSDDRINLQVLCNRCNVSKRDKMPADWKGR